MNDINSVTYKFANGSSITTIPSERNVAGRRKKLAMQQISSYWENHPVEQLEYFYNCKFHWWEKVLLRLECKWIYLKKLLRG